MGIIINHMSATESASVRQNYTGNSSWLDELKSITGRGHVFQEIEENSNVMRMGKMIKTVNKWKFKPLTDTERAEFGYNNYAYCQE